MNRRELFRGIVGVGAGLVLPATLEANAETARRWWSLGAINDAVMRSVVSNQIYLRDHEYAPILILSSAMGETYIDRAMRHDLGMPVLRDEVLTHARWLRERGACDLWLNNERMTSDTFLA